MRWDRPPTHEVSVSLPAWVVERVDYSPPYDSDEDRMRLVIGLARENIERGTGGPFGAAIFERETGLLISVGVNSVVRLNNSTVHAEMAAIQLAGKRVGSYSLAAPGQPEHELVTSCAPCAMCLGAAHWSGITRLVFGALRQDAESVAFDEGPVSDESYAYLADRGVEVTSGILRAEASAVLQRYKEMGGEIYNAR